MSSLIDYVKLHTVRLWFSKIKAYQNSREEGKSKVLGDLKKIEWHVANILCVLDLFLSNVSNLDMRKIVVPLFMIMPIGSWWTQQPLRPCISSSVELGL